MARLAGKIAIITGAASGLGEAEARLFAREGATVVASDVQGDLLNSLVARINESRGNAIGVIHDVTDRTHWEHVIRLTLEKYQKIDILVNNAGIGGPGGFLNDKWKKVIEVNLFGTALGMDSVTPEMKKAGGGSIINISSIAGISSRGGYTPYTASKGAVRAISKNAARKFAKDKIRVNTIYPGYIVTPMLVPQLESEERRKALLADIPMGRLGLPEDIANAVLFLASDEASYITGAELIIDGGIMTF